MALFTAVQKAQLVLTKQMTFKEIEALEKQALEEAKTDDVVKQNMGGQESKGEPETKPKEEPKEDPKKESKEEPKEDEKDKRIAELEEQLKEAQAANVHGNSGGNEPSFDEYLSKNIKDLRLF